jgi:lysophospholipase L1-like esterase
MRKTAFTISLIMITVFASSFAQKKEDWAGLRRYREANAKLGLPGSGEKRVVFMGNSITDAWVDEDPGFFAGKSYIGRGISGQTTPQMLLRFRADVIALKPAAVVILAGINDIAGNTGPSTLEMIMDNITSMAELAQANNIVPILCSLLPAYECQWNPGQEPAEKVIALNKMIKSYASAHKLIYVDYYTPMVDERKGLKVMYQVDEVHPNLAGYHVMEPLVEEAISKALKKR